MSEKKSLHQELNVTITNRDKSKMQCVGNMQTLLNEATAKNFSLQFSAQAINAVKDFKLAYLAKNTALKGFRPGKAPLNVVWQSNQQELMSEILNDVVQHTNETIRENLSLDLAVSPRVSIKDFDLEKGLEFDIEFEIMPKIEMPSLEKISLNKEVFEISDADLKDRIKELKSKNKNYKKAEDSYKSAKGDRLVIDFEGKIDGVAFPGGTAKGHTLELGSNTFIPGFEDQLLKHKTGEEVLVKVSFPENYHERNFAGKAAEFTVKINEILQASEFANDEEFAKYAGLPSVEELNNLVKAGLEKDCNARIAAKVKKELFDALDKVCNFELPKTMVDEEFKGLWQKLEDLKQQGQVELDKPEEELKTEYLAIAKRRIRLGLLLTEMAKHYDIQIQQDDITNAVRERAMGNPAIAQQIVKYYVENPKAIDQLKGPILEEKVVQHITSLVKINEKPIAVKKLLAEEIN